jgi:hypothetical protein
MMWEGVSFHNSDSVSQWVAYSSRSRTKPCLARAVLRFTRSKQSLAAFGPRCPA